MKVKGILSLVLYVLIQRLAGAPGVESRGPVSRDRLLWQKLTLLLFQTLLFVRQRSGFWLILFLVCYAGAPLVFDVREQQQQQHT